MALLTLVSCSRAMEETIPGGDSECYPEGTPVTLKLGFGTPDFLDVIFGTKAEASAADESRIRELYVLLFDEDGNKFYGRNFSYAQKISSLPTLVNDTDNDGWYVETDEAGITTRGVVKLPLFPSRAAPWWYWPTYPIPSATSALPPKWWTISPASVRWSS